MSDGLPTEDEVKKQLMIWLIQWTPRKWWQTCLKMWILKELQDD